MAQASTLRAGMVVRLKNGIYKILESNVHSGGGRMGAMVHVKMGHVETGSILESRFEPKQEIEILELQRVKMQYLYSEGEKFTFMNLQTYDQVEIPRAAIGPVARFLKESEEVEVELFEGRPLSVHYPPVVELKIVSTGAGIRGQTDSTFKQATLENGLEILVPQFIEEGDSVRVDVNTGKYLDRARERSSSS